MKTLQHIIENCDKCAFNRLTDARYCGGKGRDHRVMFIAESPSTSGGRGIFDAELNFENAIFNRVRKKYKLDDCYTTDLVKCGMARSKPTYENYKNCKQYLLREIKLIKPKLIVAVGKSISLNNGSKKETFNFLQFLSDLLFESKIYNIQLTWTYHYAYIERYNKNKSSKLAEYDNQHKRIRAIIDALK